ncbi:hypothetical protein Tco_0888687 [Tanacetum coccineum]
MVISSPYLTDFKNWLVQSKRFCMASPKQTAWSFLTPMEVLYLHNSALSKLQEDCMGSIQFIQLLLSNQNGLLLPHTRTYPTPILTSKLFSNMRRASKGYSGVVTPLFENMLVQAQDEEQQQSPSRITSSPSLSPQPTLPSP